VAYDIEIQNFTASSTGTQVGDTEENLPKTEEKIMKSAPGRTLSEIIGNFVEAGKTPSLNAT
jgi:hypothetical protein